MLVFHQVGQRFVEPAFLVLPARARQVLAEVVFGEDDGVGVFVGDEGAEEGPRLEVSAEVHHVAAVAEGRLQVAAEIAAADEAGELGRAALHVRQLAAEQDGEAAVAVHVQGPAQGARPDLSVERADHVVDGRL